MKVANILKIKVTKKELKTMWKEYCKEAKEWNEKPLSFKEWNYQLLFCTPNEELIDIFNDFKANKVISYDFYDNTKDIQIEKER